MMVDVSTWEGFASYAIAGSHGYSSYVRANRPLASLLCSNWPPGSLILCLRVRWSSRSWRRRSKNSMFDSKLHISRDSPPGPSRDPNIGCRTRIERNIGKNQSDDGRSTATQPSRVNVRAVFCARLYGTAAGTSLVPVSRYNLDCCRRPRPCQPASPAVGRGSSGARTSGSPWRWRSGALPRW